MSPDPVKDHVAPKLPLELIDKILLLFNNGDGDQLENLKKSRLISKQWYLGVMEHFLNQDKVSEKFRSHFDGSRNSFVESMRFGYNIYGTHKLSLKTLRISNSEFYLLKSILAKMIMENLETLELKDNRLKIKEMIRVFDGFKKIKNLKVIESSQGLEKSQNMKELYDEDMMNTIKVEVEALRKPCFLCYLENLEVVVIHVNQINMISAIVSQSKWKLKSFSIKINSHQNFNCSDCSNEEDESQIESLTHFEKFSEALRTFSIILDVDSNDQMIQIARDVFSNPTRFTKIQYLIYKEPLISLNDRKFMSNFAQFVKDQENLISLYISTIQDVFVPESNIVDDEKRIKKLQEFMENLMRVGKNVWFGYKGASLGFQPILELSKNVMNLTVSHENFNFNDPNIPVFANCFELKVNGDDHRKFPTQINGMIRIFPNLRRLSFITNHDGNQIDDNSGNPQLSNESLQLIFKNYSNLRELHLKNCIDHLTDSGFTGLTSDSLEVRSAYPDLPIEPEERIGLPISNLKKLEVLVIQSPIAPNLQITNMSIQYGFEGMRNLKKVQIENTNITGEGFELLKENTGSKNLKIEF